MYYLKKWMIFYMFIKFIVSILFLLVLNYVFVIVGLLIVVVFVFVVIIVVIIILKRRGKGWDILDDNFSFYIFIEYLML